MHTQGDLRPGNPYVFRMYPMMLYKAHECRLSNNKMLSAIEEPRRVLFTSGPAGDDAWMQAREEAQSFNSKCQRIVNDADEEARARSEGWAVGHEEAMKVHLAVEREVALVAGQRNIADAGMSERALAERDAFEAANFGHQGEIKEQRTVKNYDNPGRSNVAKKEHPKTRDARLRREAKEAAAQAGN